ncbi:methytransferase partner Trm112 [Halopiger goleimassiliensis]|uniref:methytransferase partner Trm112 n=1 Tax=Halopiger goleimassiliensis TaxID=1293048 RepID=UPI000677B95B|nr:methytransferase partner Trm112 [Halopiger goleimassiliensis]
MKESLLDILRCPLDKHELELEDAAYDGDEIVDGALVCGDCGERYPIDDGIPNLLPPDMREESPA